MEKTIRHILYTAVVAAVFASCAAYKQTDQTDPPAPAPMIAAAPETDPPEAAEAEPMEAVADTPPEAFSGYDYRISFNDLPYDSVDARIMKPQKADYADWNPDFSMQILRVYGPDTDQDWSVKMNDAILHASTDWLTALESNRETLMPDILCHNKRYFSFCNTLRFLGGSRYFYTYNFITIDALTCERVYLNDLIGITEEFAELLWSGGAITQVDSLPHHFYHGDEPESAISYRDVVRRSWRGLDAEYDLFRMELGLIEFPDSKTPLFFGPGSNFCVEPGKLEILTRFGANDYYIDIPLDNIEPFLKVPKW